MAEAKRKDWQAIREEELKNKQNSESIEQSEEQKTQSADQAEQEQKPGEGERQQEKSVNNSQKIIAKTRGGEVDKTRKHTFIYATKQILIF